MADEISKEAEERLNRIKVIYPDPKSAVMPALFIAQEELGVLNDTAIEWVSRQLDIPPVHVRELVTFYTMYHRKPIGKYHVQVCRTLSCGICGAKKLVERLRSRLGVAAGEVTPDGTWSYDEVECLGSCGTAPMCAINDHYFENLTPEKLDELMDRIEREQPDLSFSTKRGELGEGLPGYPKSQIR